MKLEALPIPVLRLALGTSLPKISNQSACFTLEAAL